MDKDNVELTINLLGFFLENLSQAIVQNTVESLQYDLDEITESIKYCPDRQIAALKNAYAMIQCDYKHEENRLIKFIQNKIVGLKEHKFRILMTPSSSQNVHVLNYWMKELGDMLGFGMVFTSKLGTMGQDPFDGHRGNALKAFLDSFSPEVVIGILTDEVNKNNVMMCDLMNEIYKSNLTDMKKKDLGINIMDLEKCNKVTPKAIEYFLIHKMKVINKNDN